MKAAFKEVAPWEFFPWRLFSLSSKESASTSYNKISHDEAEESALIAIPLLVCPARKAFSPFMRRAFFFFSFLFPLSSLFLRSSFSVTVEKKGCSRAFREIQKNSRSVLFSLREGLFGKEERVRFFGSSFLRQDASFSSSHAYLHAG